jgi:hypothetical protein
MMLIWDSVTRSSKMRLHLTIGAIVMAYLAASFVTSRSPIHVLVTSSTFDPWTAYYRLLIWEHGLNNVWDNVTMGIGLAEWERPQWMVASTVDAFWLVTAMRTGVPAFLLLCLSIFLIGRAVTKRTSASKDKELQRLALGWMISLIALCLIGATVHYWNVPHTYFYFVIGLGGWLADPKRAKKALANVHRRQVPPAYAHAAPLRPAPALRPIPLPSA